MKSALTFIKNKINNKDFAQALTQVVYQYCTNPECKPTSLDKLNVCGYCRVVRTTHGMPPGNYGDDFRDNCDEHNVIVVCNPTKKWYTYLVLPPIKLQHDLWSFVFESRDYCYCYSKDGFLKDSTIISNCSGDELLVEEYYFDEADSIPGSKIFPANFIPFSKYCLKYVDSDKKPDCNTMVAAYNRSIK